MLRFVEKTRSSNRQNAPSEPVGCVELAMTHRPAPGASFDALCSRETWFAPNVPLAPVLAPHASRPLPSAGNWVCFSCSIPPLFVLSHSMPMINTTDKLALFGAFLSPLAPSLWIHWPLFFRPTPAPAPPAGSGRAQRFPAGYCLTPTAEFIGKDRTESNLDERSLYFIMSPNRAIHCGKIKPFLPTRRRTTVDHSLSRPEGLNASGSRRACRMAMSPSAQHSILLIRSDQTRIVKQRALPDYPSAFLFPNGISRFGQQVPHPCTY